MSDSTDFAVSLPTDTGTFTAASMLPVGLLDTNHVLLLADDVAPDEVEALALSQDIQSGWVGVSSLQLFPGVSLLGPWKVDAEMRDLLGAPEWTTQLMILDCPRIRAGALPAELVGLDPLSDAFPHAQPTGAELVALTRLRAIARRLAGALRLIPGGDNEDPVLVEPSPEVSASLTVYAPVWLGPEDLVAVLQPVAPEVSAALEAVQPRGAVGLDAIDPEHEGWGRIEVRAGATDGLPLAVRGEPWARGAVLSYDLRWIPLDQADAYAEVVSRSRRRERQTARDLVEELATVLVAAVSGVAVDDDGFLVSLGEDAEEA